MDLAFASAAEQARLVRSGKATSVELVQLSLDRIAELDPTLNAFVTVDGERALEAARAADASKSAAPFRGVPIAVKDLSPTAGLRTTYSSRAYADHVPDFDTAVVRRLREAGFVIVGKTNTPEFGTVAFTESELNGATRNPWNVELTPGGSSGGAAAALAAGLIPIAHGSDGGGSIRIPASCCGVVGLKPARGRVSSAPFGSLEGLSTSGPITRTVEDAALLLDVLAGYEPGDPWWAPPPAQPFAEAAKTPSGRLRIAVTATPPMDTAVDPECVAALSADRRPPDRARSRRPGVDAALDRAEPDRLVRPRLAGRTGAPSRRGPVTSHGPQSRAGRGRPDDIGRRLRPHRPAAPGVVAQDRVLLGRRRHRRDPDARPAARAHRLAGRGRAARSRSSAATPQFTPFTAVANLTGQPAMSLPLHWSSGGMPIGVQLIGPPAGEATLLALAAQIEIARPWSDRRPPVS